MLEKFYFYYTNDLHSHFAQWPRVVRFLKDKKRRSRKKKRNLLAGGYWGPC
ncbi:hypothetical protein RWE15_00540 [Virgibacillus halophilus]|uniref:Uncharacterized protein n=1 Tax=Tigheibacillus halophilus TaxID=361280 RepID=A0ABU5C2Y5_9BACI|nr:hypothetical protein [Virgibacillus halophilus]